MAVLSRPSRRSLRRGGDSESPATEDGHHPKSRNGKRTRDSSLGNESTSSNKKLKTNVALNTNKIILPNRYSLESLPIRGRQPSSHDVTTKPRKLDPVLVQRQPHTNGLIHVNKQPHTPLQIGINQNVSIPIGEADKRSLRSHDGGSRSKSELEPYFNNYDELISIEPKEPDFLTPDTILHIFEEPPNLINASHASLASKISVDRGKQQTNGSFVTFPVIEWPEETFTTLNNATLIELPTLDHRLRKTTKDPLDDSIYLKEHAREERKEKQLRNIEKERAMHEKFQLERLLDGLKGHDWLRVMGISGITDSEKKAYEPKRDHLISEVQILLDKFRQWKEEEKRRKAEREGVMNEDDEEEEEVSADSADNEANTDAASDGDPPDYGEVDDSAAQQLRMEVIMATKAQTRPKGTSKPLPPKRPPAEKPFTSFFEKPYLRAAAIGKHRRSGRSRMAFGQPIPDYEERDFELPEEVKTTEAVLESGRRMRRSKREGRVI